jgi:DNA primase
MIPDEIIEQVRETADLLSIVGESVDLKRTGSDYRGPCPFHGGTHRNFAVIPKKNLYYCYVCHAAGDVFSYLMKRFGMDYPTAVREAARRSGIVIPETGGRSGPDPREPLFGAVAAAQDWFTRMLVERREGQGARDYLASRDVPLEEAAQRGLGFAPPGTAFLGAMRELGLADAVLLEAGLLYKRDDGSLVPRFRGRLLFPIHDLRGRVVGFGGRILGPGEPKYLNSPDTALFHKGRLLYNLHSAKNLIRREETVVLVEGYFDVLRLVLAGIEHVVAPLGTALTPDQAVLLKRAAPSAVLLYDSDTAGLRATFRAGDELLRHGVRVRVATMPPGEDPDTLVRAGGAQALAPVLADAVDVLERKIQLLERKGWFEGIEHRRNALDRLLPTIRATADPVTRELYISQVAERVGVPREIVATEAKSRAATPAAASANAAPRGTGAGDVRPRGSGAPQRRAEGFGVRAERQLLTVIIAAPEWRDRAREEVEPALFEVPAHRELFEVLRLTPPGAAQDQLPDGLSEAAQAVWTRLRESIATLGTTELDEAYTGAHQRLQARPFYRRIQTLTDPAEKRRQLDELDRKYPTFRKVRGYVRGGPTPRRGPRGIEHHPGKDRNAP